MAQEKIMKPIKLANMDCEQVCREIEDFVIEVVRQAASSGCVIGLSGGVDSSTAAALIKNSFDRYNAGRAGDAQALELVGYILPSSINVAVDESDAVSVAKHLGLRYEIHSIEALVESFKSTNPEAFENIFHKGNMISRIRANVLSTKAATENKTLSGTGNRDEDFGIGYYTLFGDGAVHFSPISWVLTNRLSSASRLPVWNRVRVTLKTWGMITMWLKWSPKAFHRGLLQKS
jgi:NAD+ synthase